MIRYFFTVFLTGVTITPACAQEVTPLPCPTAERTCLLNELALSVEQITEIKWKDIAYREMAKSLSQDGRLDDAIKVIEKISNPDTKAMTIRGIGMAAAELGLDEGSYRELFLKLVKAANSIAEPAAKEIAFTYIAMAQAYAQQDDAAILTARSMTNPALKHKAFGEMAEIQAERHDAASAIATLKEIDSKAYRNKASRTVTLILADRGMFNEAGIVAQSIENPTLKAEALQHILFKQKAPLTKEQIE